MAGSRRIFCEASGCGVEQEQKLNVEKRHQERRVPTARLRLGGAALTWTVCGAAMNSFS